MGVSVTVAGIFISYHMTSSLLALIHDTLYSSTLNLFNIVGHNNNNSNNNNNDKMKKNNTNLVCVITKIIMLSLQSLAKREVA